jgi:predicted transcriptional regulator
MDETAADMQDMLITHTTDIVVSYVANNSLGADDVSALIRNVYGTLAGLGAESAAPEARPEPAVSIRSSVKKDHIVCLEDGKKMKMLKRHLATDHAMTPADYRAKWKLPADYPMVAPAYAEKRRNLAVSIGLGRKGGRKKAVASAAPATPKVTRKPRSKKAPA